MEYVLFCKHPTPDGNERMDKIHFDGYSYTQILASVVELLVNGKEFSLTVRKEIE